MAETILVLSANSKVGAEAARQLQSTGANVRLGVRNPAKQALTGAVEADLDRPETLVTAMDGVSKVLLTTAATANQVEQHSAAISAAGGAGVRHMVRVSVTGADPGSPLFLLRTNGETERELETSGMAFTHLRPQSFMQNLLGMAPAIAQGQLFGCTGEGKFPVVDVRDIAAVAVAALLDPGHAGRAYEITGPAALSHGEQAEILGRVLGIPARYIHVPAAAMADGMVQAGYPQWLAEDLAYLHGEIIAKGLAAQVSRDVEAVLGRPPIDFETFARDHAAAFLKGGPGGTS